MHRGKEFSNKANSCKARISDKKKEKKIKEDEKQMDNVKGTRKKVSEGGKKEMKGNIRV